MKKILIIMFLIILSGCEKKSILNTIYISSIGIDYVDDQYVGYFYSPPTKDLGKDDNSDATTTVFVVRDKELANIFDSMYDSAVTNINMFHLKSMILSDSFNSVNSLLDYFKYNTNISYNFHVFVTEDNLEDIYEYKSIGNISNLYNFLNSPSLIDYDKYGVSRCHFLSFANNYLNSNRYNLVPLIKKENTTLEDEFQLKIVGYSNLEYLYYSDEYVAIKYLFDSDKEISIDNNIVFLKNYKVKYYVKDDIFNIEITYKKVSVSNDLDSKNFISSEIDKYFSRVIFLENELYLIKEYNYLYNKDINTSNYKIIINEL